MADPEPLTCDKAPCVSCPYRQDVPSGIWDESEYAKLPRYDGEIIEQILKGGSAPFLCHQHDHTSNVLCAGWLGTHGPHNLAALRMTGQYIGPEVWAFESPVPLFASGADAADHGMADIEDPSPEARAMSARLIRKRGL